MYRYEDQYFDNINQILSDGKTELNNRTGIRTMRIPSSIIKVDLEEEFPILQSKRVNWKVAIDEILWIMQKQSNKISELNSSIWNSWAGEDGTIGKTYGYQVHKVTKGFANQVEYVLNTLAEDASSRQCVIDLWNPEELHEMNLVPCTYSSIWSIIDGRLHCTLVQRSADYLVGVPFDTMQYAALTHMFARHLNVKPGILTHCMADSHIYDNQLKPLGTLMFQYLRKSKMLSIPKLSINSDKKTFWDITVDDFILQNYSPMPYVKFEVAV